jgi:hypothetical protein
LHLRTPAPAVIEATSIGGRADMLEALAYVEEVAPAPDRVKNAPFNIRSPSDLQFQFCHSPFDESKCFVI